MVDDTIADVKYRFLLILLMFSVGIFSVPVSAQDASSASRCNVAQNNLKNIQRPRDLQGRVDRLQAYRYIYHRIDSFVIRLERNQQPEVADLRASLVRLNDSIEQFKNDYETYDAARESVTKLSDCQENLSEFNTRLLSARQMRTKVNEDVQLIQSILSSSVKNQIDSVYQQLLISGNSEASRE